MLRVFLASSHLGTILLTIYAKRTYREDMKDVLVIDHAPKKDSLRKTIEETALLHCWEIVYDLSIPISDTDNMKPGRIKRITRKVKTYPLIGPVYRILLRNYVEKAGKKQQTLIHEAFSPDLLTSAPAELGLLMETALNGALQTTFPHAKTLLFEHGMSDYMLITEQGTDLDFYCIFSESFKSFLEKRNKPSDKVQAVLNENVFAETCDAYLRDHPDREQLAGVCDPGKAHVLILLQSIEQYHIPAKAWETMMKRILARIDDPKSCVFLLKPHPLQSHEVMEWMKEYFDRSGLSFRILNAPFILNTGVEVAFDLWKAHVTHVFSLFSSSVYYLSKLYPQEHTRYFHSYDFLLPYLKYAPEQHRSAYLAHCDLIAEVFAGNCETF